MFRRIAYISAKTLDRVDYLVTLARISVADWLAGPHPRPPPTAPSEKGASARAGSGGQPQRGRYTRSLYQPPKPPSHGT
jgi:hypothetical protein